MDRINASFAASTTRPARSAARRHERAVEASQRAALKSGTPQRSKGLSRAPKEVTNALKLTEFHVCSTRPPPVFHRFHMFF